MGTFASVLRYGHRAGSAGPLPTHYNTGRPATSDLRPGWRETIVSRQRRRSAV
jgi:hypothetical protein